MTTTPDFERLWSLGYHTLLPIVPPGAELDPESSLATRMAKIQDPAKRAKADARGKTPGVRRADGLWTSISRWHSLTATQSDLHRWGAMGAGVGIRLPDDLVLIDADTLHQDRAAIIRDEVLAMAPTVGIRVGNFPKCGYLVAVSEPMRYARIDFGGGPSADVKPERVELLTSPRQFVALGVHRDTGKPYEWPRGIPRREDLPTVTPAQLIDLLHRCAARLPAASAPHIEGGSSAAEVDQASLRGDPDLVARAVEALPNDERFATRDSYVQVGYAIKAALPDDPQRAEDLFVDWAGRWTVEPCDPGIAAADFDRCKPPYRIGAHWLYELSERLSDGRFSRAPLFLTPEPDEPENPFALVSDRLHQQSVQEAASTYPLLRIGEIFSRPPPVFLVDRHIPQKSVGFLYSEPGAGKSFIALDVGLHIAFGREDWHGDKITTDNRHVLYIAAEGSFGFRNRIRAWMRKACIDTPNDNFLMIEQTINFMAPGDVEKLIRTVESACINPALVVVDTVSRAMPGADENLQKEMTLFVAACDRVKETFGCAVLGVHHASKGGDMRGSTVLRGAGDFVFRLHREKQREIRRLECEKQKDAPDDWSAVYLFDEVEIEDGQTSLVPARAPDGGHAGALGGDTSAVDEMALAAMRAAWDAGRPWAKGARAGDNRAVLKLMNDFRYAREAAVSRLEAWEKAGVIRFELYDKKAKTSGYRVAMTRAESAESENSGGIFD